MRERRGRAAASVLGCSVADLWCYAAADFDQLMLLPVVLRTGRSVLVGQARL